MKLPFREMLFLSYLCPTNCFNVSQFHPQISTTLKKQRHGFNINSLKSFKNILGPFRVNSQEVVKAPSPIFLKFYSNCHYPIWWTSAKFERNLSRNGMIIKLFSWGVVAGGMEIIHIWPCLKPYYCQTTSVNLNISGMLVTLPNIKKITLSILWLSNVEGHAPQSWLFLALATNFRKLSNLATVLFLDCFRSYLEEFLLIKLSSTLENFIAKYQKVCEISWAKLGMK